MRMPHQPTATLSPSLAYPHRRRRRRPVPFCDLLLPHPSRPFTVLRSFLALLSRIGFSFPSQSFAPITIPPYSLPLCPSPFPPPLPIFSKHKPSSILPLSHFRSRISLSLAFLLIKIPFLLTSLSLSVLPQYTFIIFARSARNYIIVPLMILAHLFRTKKPIDSYNSFTTHFTAFPL